jgi:TrmH family RNA methyltransferase
MERITSRQNAIVKRFRERARGPDRDAGEVLLDGAHLVQEALSCGVAVDIAAFGDRHLADPGSALALLAARVERQGGRALGVSDQVLAAMSPVEHPSGVVAIGRMRAASARDAFASARDAAADAPLVVVLAGLQDPGNVGAIVRTAAACGATGLIALDGSASPFGWKALRGAMGGTFRLPIAHSGSDEAIAEAQRAGVRLVAAVPRGGTPLPDVDWRPPSAIVLGSEGGGLADAAAAAAVDRVTIPMRRPVESLNVAVAAALILYEASRQRQGVRSQ